MKINKKKLRMLHQLRTDNLFRFQSPGRSHLYLVNKKPINVKQWFGYDVSDNIVNTYVSFCVFVEEKKYKIHFEFIHNTDENKNLSEHVYKKIATQNDFRFFILLLQKAPEIKYDQI